MGPGQEETLDESVDAIRHQILASLFTGRARPGGRAPSVRRMAAMTGRSRRSVHQAYQVLAEEGLLEARHGSGTFFPDAGGVSDRNAQTPSLGELAESVRACAELARRVGLSEQVFARFFAHYVGYGLGSQRLAIVECNGEQLSLMGEELREALGVRTREILLEDLHESPHLRLSGVDSLVTTVCHRADVEGQAREAGIRVHTIAMSREFLAAIVDCATDQATLVVVRDLRYGPVLRSYLEKTGHDARLIANLAFSLPDKVSEALARLPARGAICLPRNASGPLAAASIKGWRRVHLPRFIGSDSLEGLRIELARGLALVAR